MMKNIRNTQDAESINLETDLIMGIKREVYARITQDKIVTIFQNNEIKAELELKISKDKVKDIDFSCGDSVFYVVDDNNMAYLYSLDKNNQECILNSGGYLETGKLQVIQSKDKSSIYVYGANKDITTVGYCIDIESFKIRMKIPQLVLYLPETDQVVRYDYGKRDYLLYPAYKLDELISWGEDFLKN